MKKVRFIVVALLAMILAACGGEKETAPPMEEKDKAMMETTAEKVEEVDEEMAEILDEVKTEAEEVTGGKIPEEPKVNEETTEEETGK